MVEDSNGLRSIFLEELWNSPPRIMEPTCPIYDAPSNSDMVRHRIILSCDQVEKLKKWVGTKCKSIGLETLHLSTFVVTCSLIWVCKVKSKDPDTEVTDPKDDDSYCLTFLADCRNRSKLSVPSTYFGNCLTICHVELQKEKLVGENGILEAVSAIGGEVRGLRVDPLKGFEWIVSGRRRRELGRQSQHVMIIAGSPKLNVYVIVTQQQINTWIEAGPRESVRNQLTCRTSFRGLEVS